MSLNGSRLLVAATIAAALGAFSAAPVLAAGMASSHGSMTSAQDNDDMSGSSTAMQQDRTAKPRHGNAIQEPNDGGMKTQGSMK